MRSAPLRVAVIGAGTAGAAAAILLARTGHSVSLFEVVPEPTAVGAGIMLQPTGMAVLEHLGLLPALLERGSRVDRLLAVTASGGRPDARTVLDLRYRDVHPDAFGLGMHRGLLFEVLFGAVNAEVRATVTAGCRVDRLEAKADGVRLWDEGGASHGPFELVVVADGARSRLRGRHPGLRREREYQWGALWAILEDPERRFAGVLSQALVGTKEMLGILPSGLGPRGDTPLVSIFWSIRGDRQNEWRAAGLGAWKARVLALQPLAEPLLAQLDSADQLLFARYHDVVMSPWHTADGVVFLGDAAHAMSPQLGQGANIALVDAAELADAVSQADDVASALALYGRRRRHSLAYYQWATRFLTPFFQSDHEALGMLRDIFMGPLCKLPYTRNKMVRTMCGVERGFFRAPTLLPAPKRSLGSGA